MEEKNILSQIIGLTKELIVIPSVHTQPDNIQKALDIAKKELGDKYAIEEFKDHGYQSFVMHNGKKGTKEFKIILNGHLDVVPGKPEQFIPVEKQGKLYARGAYDMKAATATLIYVFKNLVEKVNYPLALQLVTDEEAHSRYTTQYQIKQGIRGDFVICGESSSNLNITNKAKGALWITLEATGKTAHAGYLWRGDNALWKLSDTLHKIREKYPEPNEAVWKTTITLTKVETPNIAHNAVPDIARANLDIRFIYEDKDTVLDAIKKLLSPDISLEVIENTPAMYVSKQNPYVQLLQTATKNVVLDAGELQGAHATSDIRFFNKVGCLGVEFGPKGEHPHSDGEYVDVQSLEDYYHILKNFLLSVK